MKCYAIKQQTGEGKIVYSWSECQTLTNGVPFVKFKKFNDEKEALNWLEGKEISKPSNQDDRLDVVYIYCDGACSNNPGPGGWAYIVKYNGQSFEMSGYVPETTNNQMELTAMLNGINFAIANFGRDKELVVTSDSNYALNGARQWMISWAANGWKRPGGEIANLQLWKEVYKTVQGLNIKYNWIKGHSGHPENEKCDKMAVYAYAGNMDSEAKLGNACENKVFTNFDIFKVLDKDSLHLLLCSSKFQSFLMTSDTMKIREMLDMPAKDWGLDAIKKMLKDKGV